MNLKSSRDADRSRSQTRETRQARDTSKRIRKSSGRNPITLKFCRISVCGSLTFRPESRTEVPSMHWQGTREHSMQKSVARKAEQPLTCERQTPRCLDRSKEHVPRDMSHDYCLAGLNKKVWHWRR